MPHASASPLLAATVIAVGPDEDALPLSAAAPLLFPISANLRSRLSSLPRLNTSTSTNRVVAGGTSQRRRRAGRSSQASSSAHLVVPFPTRTAPSNPPKPTLDESVATENYMTPPLLQLNNLAFTLPRTPFTAAAAASSRASDASPSFASAIASPSLSTGLHSSTTRRHVRLPLAGTKEGYRASLGVGADDVWNASQALQRCTSMQADEEEASQSLTSAIAQPPEPFSQGRVTCVAQAALGKGRPLSLIATQPQPQAPRHPARTWSLSLPTQYTHGAPLRSARVQSHHGDWSSAYASTAIVAACLRNAQEEQEEEEERDLADGLLILPCTDAKRSCEPEVGQEWTHEWPFASTSCRSPLSVPRAPSYDEQQQEAQLSSTSNHFIYEDKAVAEVEEVQQLTSPTPTPEEAYWRTPPESSFWRSSSSTSSFDVAGTRIRATSNGGANCAEHVRMAEMYLPPPALPLPALPSTPATAGAQSWFRRGCVRRACFDLREQKEEDDEAQEEPSPAPPCSATAWLMSEMQHHWSPSPRTCMSTCSSSCTTSSCASELDAKQTLTEPQKDPRHESQLVQPITLLYNDAHQRTPRSHSSRSSMTTSAAGPESESSTPASGESEVSHSRRRSCCDDSVDGAAEEEESDAEEHEKSKDVGWYAAAWTLRSDTHTQEEQWET